MMFEVGSIKLMVVTLDEHIQVKCKYLIQKDRSFKDARLSLSCIAIQFCFRVEIELINMYKRKR